MLQSSAKQDQFENPEISEARSEVMRDDCSADKRSKKRTEHESKFEPENILRAGLEEIERKKESIKKKKSEDN